MNARNKQNTLKGVFFYEDGVLNASQYIMPESDEPNPSNEWRQLAFNHQIELHVCIAAAQRRGILDNEIAKVHKLQGHSADPMFRLSGLGQLAELILSTDRFIQF